MRRRGNHPLSGKAYGKMLAGILDPANDGPEVEIIRREQENWFMDWYDSLPERWEKAWKIAFEFMERWRKP